MGDAAVAMVTVETRKAKGNLKMEVLLFWLLWNLWTVHRRQRAGSVVNLLDALSVHHHSLEALRRSYVSYRRTLFELQHDGSGRATRDPISPPRQVRLERSQSNR